ncbi:MAG: hypothetical protein ACI88A_001933 [Paraglaciecola sp.]|jgi:hypothetical protein
MKRANFNKNQSPEMPTGFHALKDRRKSYYHGKYNREVISIVVLFTLVVMYMLGQGA